MPERIQRRRTKGWRKPENCVIVTRPSRFGNPFTVADAIEAEYEDPQRACVSHFTAWVEGHDDYQDVYVVGGRRYDRRLIREHLSDLRGKDLACSCKPEDPCHVDVLLRLANADPETAAAPPCTCITTNPHAVNCRYRFWKLTHGEQP